MTNQRSPLCQLTNQGPGECQHPDTTEAALMTDMRTVTLAAVSRDIDPGQP